MTTLDSLRSKLSFRVSPLLDMAMALLVIQSPERFEHVEQWAARVTGRLPEEALLQLRDETIDGDFLALACDLDEGGLEPPDALEKVREHDRTRGDFLLAFWAALAPEIAASTAALGESLQRETARLREADVLTFIRAFSDRVGVSEDGEFLVLDWGRGLQVRLAELERVVLVPSAFCPRRLMFYRHGGTQFFFYPARRGESGDTPEVPESLLLGYAALADPTRLRILYLVARERLPAQEMARRLSIHESTVSRHIRFLIESGVVARQRQEGRFVYYTLNPGRLEALSTTLRVYLGMSRLGAPTAGREGR